MIRVARSADLPTLRDVERAAGAMFHDLGGLGKALLNTAASWAQQQGLAALTLTTYSEVPWNALYYRRLGFQVIPDAQLTGGLRRIREHERARGLTTWPRVIMRRAVSRI